MNERERKLAIIVGSAVAMAIVYYGINFLFISPLTEAKEQYESNLKKKNDLKKLVDSESRSRKSGRNMPPGHYPMMPSRLRICSDKI